MPPAFVAGWNHECRNEEQTLPRICRAKNANRNVEGER